MITGDQDLRQTGKWAPSCCFMAFFRHAGLVRQYPLFAVERMWLAGDQNGANDRTATSSP